MSTTVEIKICDSAVGSLKSCIAYFNHVVAAADRDTVLPNWSQQVMLTGGCSMLLSMEKLLYTAEQCVKDRNDDPRGDHQEKRLAKDWSYMIRRQMAYEPTW
jgi:hypothetical protein